MNEPALFERADKTMAGSTSFTASTDGTTLDIAPSTMFGMQNVRATYEGVAQVAAGRTAFVLTRARVFRRPAVCRTWTGDIHAELVNHLKIARQCS